MELGVSGVPGAHAPKQNSATEEPKFALVCVTVPLLKTVESFAQGLGPKARNVQKQIAKVRISQHLKFPTYVSRNGLFYQLQGSKKPPRCRYTRCGLG